MNKYQKQYAIAKAAVDAATERQHEIEQCYMRDHGIVDEDGNTPRAIWMIDDEQVFDAANAATATSCDALNIPKLEDALRRAEDDLLNYSLAIMPAAFTKEREVLRGVFFGANGKTINYAARKKAIDLAFRLDTKTAPKLMRA